MARSLLSFCVLALTATFVLAVPGSSATSASPLNDAPATTKGLDFITRRGDQLFDGEKRFRFISFNIPNLLVIEDAYEFTKPNPWRWPNRYELEDALESVRQMGGQVVRTYVLSVRREKSDMGETVHVLGPNQFNEQGFRAIDLLLAVAHEKGIRVILPLVDQYQWWGGIGEYAAFRGKSAEEFWTDPQLIGDFKATIRHLLLRKNSITGVVYRDDPTILGWETGNEIMPPPEWTREISAYLKSLDPNHLVLDGKSLKGLPTESLDDPNVDILSTHHYPWGNNHDYRDSIRQAHALTKNKKAYFVGEFGFVETPHIKDTIDTVIEDGITGALLWSLRMHRREGGFYWHMEGDSGKNVYKAYHWPGFSSGDRYDERNIMRLLREKAYTIRGIEPPPLPSPASPTLLPIERASHISWQGSTGASSYDIWRADRTDGEWQRIGSDVSDADLQYWPLFNDETAEPGQLAFYRVVAKNNSGESAPSNIVGPVKIVCRTLVDNCQNFSRLHRKGNAVRLATANARRTQEDAHRFALPDGEWIEYKLEGSIARWRVFTFSNNDARVNFSVSSDGNVFQPVRSERTTFEAGQTVYGYYTPVLYEGQPPNSSARYLRITGENRDINNAVKAPIEIARVEIEWDCNKANAEHLRARSE